MLAADFGRAYLPATRLTPLASYDVPGQRVTEDSDTKRTTIWSLAERSTEIAALTPYPGTCELGGPNSDRISSHASH